MANFAKRSWRRFNRVAREVRAAIFAPRYDGPGASLIKALGLNQRELEKLQKLAQVRGEPLEKALRRTLANFLAVVPRRLGQREVIRQLDLKNIELENGLVRLELANGRVFNSYPSRPEYRCIYRALRDVVPAAFTEDTYEAGANAAIRYGRGADNPMFPGPGAVVIEGGAYLGFKAVRMAEVVGDAGKVIAIEIGCRNYDLLCRNVQANGMGHIITPLRMGIWSEPGQMEADFEYTNSYHLAVPDEHSWCTHTETVPTDTLDNVIETNDLHTVDYLNLQLNGAEYEGLLGLERRFNDVKVIRTAAYYTRRGRPQVEVVRDLLRDRGCRLIHVTSNNSITAVTAPFEAELRERFERLTDRRRRKQAAS